MAFGLLFAILVVRLFQLQIVEGQSYLDEYMVLTKKDLKTNSTRGNIYDRNGYVLASNELAYNVTRTGHRRAGRQQRLEPYAEGDGRNSQKARRIGAGIL